jgi:hypothetical protein
MWSDSLDASSGSEMKGSEESLTAVVCPAVSHAEALA